jgi:hypothetical protein
LFFVEKSQEQPAEPLIRLPIDLPKVVAGRVLPVIGELESFAPLARKTIGAILTGKGALRDDVEILQLFQEVVFEPKSHSGNPEVEDMEICGLGPVHESTNVIALPPPS